MKCPKCQHFNDAAAKFCAECATPLAPTCSRCGHQLPPYAKFCPECAHPTGTTTNALAPFGLPETYTPKHLATRILNSRAALEGERKQVTILFADLKGSMELLADRDPEEARKLLDPVLELMMEAVHHYEGTVNQAAGDGIMAIFGAPLAHEDHAVRACYAALRMQERAKRHGEAVFHTHGVNVQIRVGLNSGDVVVGTVGSDLRMDYTAIGRTTHLAARMEQLASPGSILVTPSTLELVDGFVTVKPLGPVPVKGLVEPLEVHEVTGVGPVRTRFQSVARRGLTPFVGRKLELEQLRRAQRLAGSGHGQVVALVAEAGMGKSRLVYELAHLPVLDGWLVMECAAFSYGKAMSYLPVTNLLKGYFEITEQDSLQTVGDKVKTKLLALDGALAPTLPALLALLDAPVNDPAWETLDPTERRRRMLDGVRHLLLREAEHRPLLLIFEDLHWIDSETEAVLDSLVESLASARILLLVTYRPEYQHGWSGKTYYSQPRLDALVGESGGQLLNALLGHDASLSSLKQLLANNGNPFFLEEIVRTLVETKALEGSLGSYRLTRAIEAIQVPATVQAILASRIDRLSPEDKQLLQIAAVIGRSVPFRLLRTVADLPDEALRGGLHRLRAAQFVYLAGTLPRANSPTPFAEIFTDIEYSFKHVITQEVAYSSMLQERRRKLHARIVEAIETLHHSPRELHPRVVEAAARRTPENLTAYEIALRAHAHLFEADEKTDHATYQRAIAEGEEALRIDPNSVLALWSVAYAKIETLHHNRLDEQVELLAHHALRGELREKAVSYLFRAGIKAAKHSVHYNARNFYEQALALLEALPDSRIKLEQSFEIRLELRGVLSILGETRIASQRLREAEIIAGTINDERRLGRVSAMMASNNCQLAELDAAFTNGTRALSIAERSGDSTLRSITVSNLGMLYYYRAEYERAVEMITTDLAVTPDYYTSILPGAISAHCWRIRSLAELGRFSAAAAHAHEMFRLVEPTRGAFPVGMAHLTAGWYLLAQGDWTQARPLIERGVTEYRKGNIFLALPHAIASSADLLARLGERNEALNRLQEGEELLEHRIAGGTIDQAGMDYQWLGRAALLLHRLDDARRLANCSLQYSPLHPGFAAHALHLLGDIATDPDQFNADDRETHYHKALALAQPRGMRPLIAHCHLGLGKLYERIGKYEQAREHRSIAAGMYREMDMRFYLEQAEAQK